MDHLEIPLHISRLIARKMLGQLNESEKNELDSWLEVESNREIYNQIIKTENLHQNFKKMENTDLKKARLKLEEKINTEGSRKKIYIKLIRYAAAILLPLIIGGIIFQLIRTDQLFFKNEVTILPGSPKAILELSDGRQVDLEQEINQIEENNGTVIQKSDHSIVYSSENVVVTDSIEEYNTLRIPLGGEYQLVLSDGTKVWLNAGSQLRYPIRFNAHQRKIFLEGEAYFEVTHSLTHPFVVVSENIETRVLGTSFNMMAYPGDSEIITTLVEGSVELFNSENENQVIIKPGYQAISRNKDSCFEIRDVNTSVYTAWKDGRFEFDNEPLGSIMKKLGRWYNSEILFEDKKIKDIRFSARFKRYDNIEKILGNIEMTQKVKFIIDNNQITVIRND